MIQMTMREQNHSNIRWRIKRFQVFCQLSGFTGIDYRSLTRSFISY
jgi:hypothetical protein